MAKKYIGAWQVLNLIEWFMRKEQKDYGVTAVSFALGKLKNNIKNFPAADVREVRHGTWNVKDEFFIYCSRCGEASGYGCDGTHEKSFYCPNCGAKMDGKGENDAN